MTWRQANVQDGHRHGLVHIGVDALPSDYDTARYLDEYAGLLPVRPFSCRDISLEAGFRLIRAHNPTSESACELVKRANERQGAGR